MDASKRKFVQWATAGAAFCSTGPLWALGQPMTKSSHEALFYQKLSEHRIQCQLCPRECVVADLERGTCGVRENQGGVYRTLVYSHPCALNNDPIEKKPLFHFRPGSNAFSLATAGCNMECRFCQNWEISQFRPEQVASETVTPEEIVLAAQRAKAASIAFTYSEPVIFYEYMRDICYAASETGLGRVMISNGYIQPEPMKKLLPHLDAVKIDFKAFSESFYRDICSAHLSPVLKTLRQIHDEGVWLEIVVLVIPTLNDSSREFDAMTRWVVQKLGQNVPMHFTRFHPMYKLQNLPPTPVATLETARDIAKKNGVRYAYAGNVPGHASENTFCPFCDVILIQRRGFTVVRNRLTGSRCPDCGKSIAGRW